MVLEMNPPNSVNPPSFGHPNIGNHYRCYQQLPFYPNIMFPEVDNTSRQIPESLQLNHNDKYKLMTLLTQWNMKFVFKACCEALVDVEALKCITPPQCEALLSNYPLGIRIKFIAKVHNWQHDVACEMDNHVLLPLFSNSFL